MKKSLLLLLLIVSFAHAQKKYQSLLWEISGNGLTKNSYLYGSMHVSEKVSYHLSDAFFKHLLAADFVANESEPSSWIEIYDVLNTDLNYENTHNDKFYSTFYQQPIKKEQLYPLFVNNNHTLNNILFRTSETEKEYQEDTYLDMFIHQTGKKYRKQTIGLENAKSSMITIMNIETTEMKPKEQNVQAIMKLLKEKSFNQALLDYYRDKNLDMIDSIYTLIAPENYLKTMLYDRNVVMTQSIDSIMRKGSLFAAIGAAHLPGKNGVIESLRQKGFTVTPVIDAYTEKGKLIKKEIDDYFVKPVFETLATADGMMRLPMTTKAIYSGDDISTPDLSNGGIINLKRVPLRNYLRKDAIGFDPQTIDSLFYENIPGDILEKRQFSEDNYMVFDIKSRTTTGNAQRYRYYITPLEIINVSMSGNGDYVRKYENEIFNNISVRNGSTAWETITPNKGGFSVSAPAYHLLYGNRESSNPADVELTAYDATEKGYYFITEKTLLDNENLEDTQFELQRIQDEFLTQIGAVKLSGIPTATGYESEATLGERTVSLKTLVHGQKYYMLGAVDASARNAARFFESFRLLPFHYNDPVRTLIDKEAYFSISIPEKQNEKLFWKSEPAKKKWNPVTKENIFVGKTNNYNFTSASGKTVELKFLEYHRYATEKNMDSVWTYFRRSIKKDYADEVYESDVPQHSLESPQLYLKNGFSKSSWEKSLGKNLQAASPILLKDEKITFNNEQQYYVMDVTATTANSAQEIRYRAIFKNGLSYYFETLVEKDYKKDDSFIETTFNSFKLLDVPQQRSIFSSKMDLFMDDIQSENDSIRHSAIASVYMLDPVASDLPRLKKFLMTLTFEPEEMQAQTDLLEKIGTIDDPEVIPFLENQYKSAGTNTILQFAVLRALANNESKAAYKKIMELLEYDLPLSDNPYEIAGIFRHFSSDLENSQVLFPDIFQFYPVGEYHDPIINFTNSLLENGYVKTQKLSAFKKMLLTNAKLEYKRVASWKSKQDAKLDTEDSYESTPPVSDLTDYLNLLIRFKKDRSVADLIRKIKLLKIDEVNIEVARLELISNNTLDKETQLELLENPATSFITYQLLLNAKQMQNIATWDDNMIADAAIVHFEQIKVPSDHFSIIDTRVVPVGEKEVTYYFYRITGSTDENRYNEYAKFTDRLAAVAFVNQKDGLDPRAFKSVPAQDIRDEDQIQQQIHAMIDASLNTSRTRASFGKQENSYNIMYDGY
ncbi:MAG TPA: TraB/GumN family protein [Flavobacterium sp.]